MKTILESRRSVFAFMGGAVLGSTAIAQPRGAAADTAAGAQPPQDIAKALSRNGLFTGSLDTPYPTPTITLAPSASIFSAHLAGAREQKSLLESPANAANIKISNTILRSPGGIAFHQNKANAANTKIIGSSIFSSGYGILANRNGRDSASFLVMGSTVESDTSDAIEWNQPDANCRAYSAIGNFLSAKQGGSEATAGFAVGIAGTQSHITVANQILQARNAAIHLEDAQARGVVVGNSASGCMKDGFTAQAGTGASGDGAVVASNQFNAAGPNAGTGVWNIHDRNGVVRLHAISSNRARGFRTGYWLDGAGIQATENNVSLDCQTGLKLGNQAVGLGHWYSQNTANPATLGALSIGGKLVSQSPVSALIARSGNPAPGGYVKGFLIPLAPSDAARALAVCPLPTRMAGRLTVMFSSGGQGGMFSADIAWNGKELNVSGTVSHFTGTVSVAALRADDGKLTAQLAGSGAVTAGYADFDGIYYQA